MIKDKDTLEDKAIKLKCTNCNYDGEMKYYQDYRNIGTVNINNMDCRLEKTISYEINIFCPICETILKVILSENKIDYSKYILNL